jgi:hypothetical protein
MENVTSNKNQKPWYTKWWVWIIILVIFSQFFKNNDSSNSESKSKHKSIDYTTYCGYCSKGIIEGQIVTFYDNKSFCDENCRLNYAVHQ